MACGCCRDSEAVAVAGAVAAVAAPLGTECRRPRSRVPCAGHRKHSMAAKTVFGIRRFPHKNGCNSGGGASLAEGGEIENNEIEEEPSRKAAVMAEASFSSLLSL